MLIEEEFKRWERLRDSLRIDERPIFDDLMDDCRRYASAAGAGCFPVKTEGMFLSILFSHHKCLKELCDKVDRIDSLLERFHQSR